MVRSEPNRNKMVAAVLDAFPQEFIRLSREEQALSVQLYRLLAGGEPVPRERIAKALNFSNELVNGILDRWPGVLSDRQGRIIGYWGLALPEMAHRFVVDGRTLYTWCAWDSLFIPQILEQTARVESPCPVTGEKIRLTVTPAGVERLEPAAAVMSFMTPEQAKLRENVILNFCHYVYFFRSGEAGSKWVAENPGTFILSIAEAYALGQKKNANQYKALCGADGG